MLVVCLFVQFEMLYILAGTTGFNLLWHNWIVYELQHDKTNKMSVHPAKTQISLGIRPV